MAKRFLFYCSTPYQLLNSINFVSNNLENSKDCSDLFISHKFVNSYLICENIKKYNIFNNIYDYEMKSRNLIYKSVRKLIEYISALKKFKHLNGDYNAIILGVVDILSMSLYKAFPDAELIFLDEGTGSYNDNQNIVPESFFRRIFYRYILRDKILLRKNNIKKIYINNKEIYESNIFTDVYKLPAINKTNIIFKDMFDLFQYKNNMEYIKYNFIYLTTPNTEQDFELLNYAHEIINDKLIVRVHPHQTYKDYNKFNCDIFNNLWELECINQITEKHILIGIFSTAQINPKIIINTEPYIIFTYKLISNLQILSSKQIEDFIKNKLMPFYTNPEKIFIPNTVDEFFQILIKLKDIII